MITLKIIIIIYYLHFYFIKCLESHKFGKIQQPPLFVDIPILSAMNQSTEHFLFSPSVTVEFSRIYTTDMQKSPRPSSNTQGPL